MRKKWLLLLLADLLILLAVAAIWIGKPYHVNEERSRAFEKNDLEDYAELVALLDWDAEQMLRDNPGQKRVRYAVGYAFEHDWDEVFSGAAESAGAYLPVWIRHINDHEDVPVAGQEDILRCMARLMERSGRLINNLYVGQDQTILTTDTAGWMLFYVRGDKAVPRDIDGGRLGGNHVLYKLCDHWYEAVAH